MHSLALPSDGTVAVWGDNFRGQRGTHLGPVVASYLPVAVDAGS
jgi:hypothetical protein